MKRHSLGLFALVVALAPASTVQAQGRTWIVDAANGPGADFIDLPPAVAAAADGDLIRMRPGVYVGATISKALTVLGGRDVTIQTLFSSFAVTNLGAGKQVVIEQIADLPGLAVTNNQGRVLLDRLTTRVNSTVGIADSRQVQVTGCLFRGPTEWVSSSIPTLRITRSTVAVVDSEVAGGDANLFRGPTLGSPAIGAYDSRVTIARSRVQGGAGMVNGTIRLAARPGIDSSGSELDVSGDPSSYVAAGATSPIAAPAITISGGSLTVDPDVRLVPVAGGPEISGTAAIVKAWLPSLLASGAPPGGVLTADLFSPAGDVVLFEVGLSADPITILPFGDFWLDLQLHFITGVAVQPASRHLAHSIPLPTDPSLAFGAWTIQAFSGTVANGFKFSNPVGFALD